MDGETKIVVEGNRKKVLCTVDISKKKNEVCLFTFTLIEEEDDSPPEPDERWVASDDSKPTGCKVNWLEDGGDERKQNEDQAEQDEAKNKSQAEKGEAKNKSHKAMNKNQADQGGTKSQNRAEEDKAKQVSEKVKQNVRRKRTRPTSSAKSKRLRRP